MAKWKRKMGRLIQRVIDRAMGSGLMQEENTASGEKETTPGFAPLLRQAGAESAVLLKNDGALPLETGKTVAVFGRCQLDWFYVGYGSGGDVKAPYYVNLIDGIRNVGLRPEEGLLDTYRSWTAQEENRADHGWWGHWPMNYSEMPLDGDTVSRAARSADTALIVIGRAAGEDRENTLTEGSYYLTALERQMLDEVTKAFRRVVAVLNIGNIIDLSWLEEYGAKISAAVIVWQCGMESGNAAADVLSGRVSPCGRLSATVARRYEDYPSSAHFGSKEFNEYAEGIFVGYRHFFTKAPEAVLYPFGYGLSYTDFSVAPRAVRLADGAAEVSVTVTNTGGRPGKEVVQLWCAQPEGAMEKSARVLCAFGKTEELQPGESGTLTLRCTEKELSSYDEARHAFVLEAGTYAFSVNGIPAGTVTVEAGRVVEQCEAICLPPEKLRGRILSRLPEELPETAGACGSFDEVRSGEKPLSAFIAGLTDGELEALSRGEGMMNSALGAPGNAGAFGGVIASLREKGVRPVITADGPAGLRLKQYCSLLPCGTALACTWNTELVEAVYAGVSGEMTRRGVDVMLAPGMNIHRNPLCGRNFEYYSEDPLLSGKMAAAAVRGIQSAGHVACPKHFACNNQETKRSTNDSRVSERALREIYLRNFEICVKEGRPKTLMTSYNKVNGVWSHYNYDLVTTVLRGEWGFRGCVLTDWWMRRAKSPEFPKLRDNAYRVRSQVDVLMPGDMGHLAKAYRSDGSLLETLGKPEGITRAELQRGARNVLSLLLRLG